jgi:hypothetical protein
VVLVELLAPGQGAPWDQLVHIGVAGVVADRLALDAAPGGRADDLARLRLDVAEADLLVLAVQRQVGTWSRRSACPAPPRPSRPRGRWFRAPAAAPLRRRRCRSRSSACPGHALGPSQAVELAELLDLGLGVPADALAAVATLSIRGPGR